MLGKSQMTLEAKDRTPRDQQSQELETSEKGLMLKKKISYIVTTWRGGTGRVGGREMQEGRDMETYV